MLENALQALSIIADPMRFAILLLGMIVGGIIGMMPGLGGVTVIAILLPAIYVFDAYTGLAFLIGALGVVYTADTITSILVGTPGSPASAPTAIEGHAMAKRGEAARALSAGFLSSMIGGLIGAIVLTFAIPVAGPLVLAMGSAELFMFTVVGLYYAGSLLGKSPIKGLLAALFGLLLGMVGAAPASPEFRFVFSQVYLMGGLNIVVLALGVFGIAEVTSILSRGGAISQTAMLGHGWRDGIRDVMRHKWLVIKGALIGAITGIVPAVGANASTWIAYGHAVSVSKDKSKFGKGDVRGIIASEGANNSTVAADLVPTLLFSVPGGPAAAVFMGALFAYGYYPGPRFVQDHMDLMFTIIWSVVISSVLGAAICFLISPYIAKLTSIRFSLIAAPLILVMVLGAYQATQHFGDIILLVAFGVLGWAMTRGGWPRAPMLIGFVLANPMERQLWLTWRLHGWDWLLFPGVLIIASFIILPTLYNLIQHVRNRYMNENRPKATQVSSGQALPLSARVNSSSTLSLIFLGIFVLALWQTMQFYPEARLLPLAIVTPGVILALLQFVNEWRRPWQGDEDELAASSEASRRSTARSELLHFSGLVLFGLALWLFGFYVATISFMLAILLFKARMQWWSALIYTATVVIILDRMAAFVNIRLPPPFLF